MPSVSIPHSPGHREPEGKILYPALKADSSWTQAFLSVKGDG